MEFNRAALFITAFIAVLVSLIFSNVPHRTALADGRRVEVRTSVSLVGPTRPRTNLRQRAGLGCWAISA